MKVMNFHSFLSAKVIFYEVQQVLKIWHWNS